MFSVFQSLDAQTNNQQVIDTISKRIDLDEVVVSSSGFAERKKNIAQKIEVISAKNIAQSFVNAIKGIDVSGKGQDVILKNLQSMANLSLEDWNQVLVEYCKLPKDWDSENLYVDLKDEVGFSFSKGNTNDYESKC